MASTCTSSIFAVIILLLSATEVHSQSVTCSGFEIENGWTVSAASPMWFYSNEDSPLFIKHDSGFIWSNYSSGTKPIITSPLMTGISAATTFSLEFAVEASQQSIYISFLKLSSNTKTTIARLKGSDSYAWTKFDGNCGGSSNNACCASSTGSCSGWFVIEGGQINKDQEMAIDTFSTNGGQCAAAQNMPCSTFDDWGDWTYTADWKLSQSTAPDQVIPTRDGNYAWTDFTESPTDTHVPSLISPIVTVTSSTKYSFDYYSGPQSNVSIMFQRTSTGKKVNVTLSSDVYLSDKVEAWTTFFADCNKTNSEAYCCGDDATEMDTCYGQFVIVGDGLHSGSVFALDSFSVNGACDAPTTTTEAPTTTTGSTTTTTDALTTTTDAPTTTADAPATTTQTTTSAPSTDETTTTNPSDSPTTGTTASTTTVSTSTTTKSASGVVSASSLSIMFLAVVSLFANHS